MSARLQGISINLRAFLDMIAFSEGTAGRGDDGYNILVGGSTFHDYSKHPNIVVRLNKTLKSTAAGRYQILFRTYKSLSKQYGIKDFTPESQDRMAIRLMRERGAISDIESGNILSAIKKCSAVWASFPGNPYGQPIHSLETLSVAYKSAREAKIA